MILGVGLVKKILVGVDGSDNSFRALDFAIDLAKKYSASLYMIYVTARSSVPEWVKEYLRSKEVDWPDEKVYLDTVCDVVVNRAKDRIESQNLKNFEIICEHGDAADKILKAAKSKGADIIVLGSRGTGGFKGLLMGSVSSKVCHSSPSTCVIVK